MSDVIIDTNVAVVANRQNPGVAPDCIEACIVFLARARTEHVVLLDGGDEVRAEYVRALHQRRPYELGAQFLIHVYQQLGNPKRVRIVDLPKTTSGAFVDFPQVPDLERFDPSDRKFAALARKTGTAVTNAVDGDWIEFLAPLCTNGIAVDFLCGSDKASWFTE